MIGTGLPPSEVPDPRASVERLLGPVRARIEAAPAAKVRYRARAGLALAAGLAATATVVVMASSVVHGEQAAGLTVLPSARGQLLVVACLLALLTVSATHVSLTRGRTGLGAPVSLLVAAGLLAVPAYAALVLVHPLHAGDPPALTAGLSPWGARCLIVAALVGALSFGALAAALRDAVPVARRWRGGVMGAAAGLWSGLAVFVFCPAGELDHLLIGHVAPVAMFTLLGLMVVPALLRS